MWGIGKGRLVARKRDIVAAAFSAVHYRLHVGWLVPLAHLDLAQVDAR